MYNYQSLYSRYVAPGYEDKTDASHQVAKYLSFSFSIGPSNGYSGLISFRMDWLDLLAVQGTTKSPRTCPGPFPSTYISLALVWCCA